MARMTMSKEELAILRKAIAENAYLLDGIEESTFANSKTAEFVDQYGIDEADELIEFICNRPDEMYFSPAHNVQRRDGSFIFEEDAWVLRRWSPKYQARAYMKVWHLHSNLKRQIAVHPF